MSARIPATYVRRTIDLHCTSFESEPLPFQNTPKKTHTSAKIDRFYVWCLVVSGIDYCTIWHLDLRNAVVMRSKDTTSCAHKITSFPCKPSDVTGDVHDQRELGRVEQDMSIKHISGEHRCRHARWRGVPPGATRARYRQHN